MCTKILMFYSLIEFISFSAYFHLIFQGRAFLLFGQHPVLLLRLRNLFQRDWLVANAEPCENSHVDEHQNCEQHELVDLRVEEPRADDNCDDDVAHGDRQQPAALQH